MMGRLKTNQRILILLLSGIVITGVIIVCLFFLSKQDSHRINPANGQLDLRNWIPRRDGILNLSGQWDFYWQRFLTYQEILHNNPAPDLEANAPDVWNNYQLQGKKLPGFGYATYRLKVTGASKGMPLSLRIPAFSTSYKLFINNQLISSNGKIGSSQQQAIPQYQPRVVEFTPDGASFELIAQVANFTYARGGMWYALNLGTPEQIHQLDRTIVDKDLILFGALAVMALYYLSIFLLRREDKSSLYFVLMCLLLASRIAVYGDYLIYRLVPAISFQAIITIEYITVCWFPIFSALMVAQLFPEEASKKVLNVAVVYGLIMVALFMLTPISFYTSLVYLVQIAAIGTGCYAAVCSMRAFINRKKDALLILFGALTVIICAIHDVLYQNSLILSNYGELIPIGLFILLFLQSFVLARRFSKAFHDVEALSQKLLKLDKIKDEFLANTSHELRTPLSGILSITEAMMRGDIAFRGGAASSEGEALSDEQKQNLAIISSSSRRLANLVNDILDYSKLKYGDLRLNIKPIRVDGLFRTVVKVFQQLSESKEFEVILDLPPGLPPVLADENRLVQILYNLIGNAVKFTKRGYVKVSAKVTLVTKVTKGIPAMLEICISDTGEGIPKDKLEDIFKSFEQVDTSLTRKYGGTGLGLSITKQLVELEGGSIWVTSTLGAGSEFYFTLPLAGEIPAESMYAFSRGEGELALPELAAVFETQSITIKKTTNGNHILLVDDDPVNLQSSGALLQIGGYTVTAVRNGQAALDEIAKLQDCYLVILDVMMPEMSGYEVCRKIRESKSHFELPVLMLTAKTAVADIVMGFEAGANDYLPKPFEPEELLARVGTLVNLKKSVDKAITAEAAFMQAQIKPHFLFNTLNTISSFCDTAPSQARRLIDEFSNYLRQSFDFKNLSMYVSLTHEISLVKSYVEIEKARFGDQLKVEFVIGEVGDVKIPSLSIQPLVENAIRHGIRKKGGSGAVTVSVRKMPEGILIAVTDDGIGIPRDQLARVLERDNGRGVGLWNIDFRLKKLFGKGLIIESEPGQGARVSFLIPPEVS